LKLIIDSIGITTHHFLPIYLPVLQGYHHLSHWLTWPLMHSDIPSVLLYGCPSAAASLLCKSFLSCFPKTSFKWTHQLTWMPTCVQANGVSQQSAEGNYNRVWVWGLKSATSSPSLVTPNIRTLLFPFYVSCSRHVPCCLLSPTYLCVVCEQHREWGIIDPAFKSMVIACRAMSCAMSGQKSRQHAHIETWSGPRFPHQAKEIREPKMVSSQSLVKPSFDDEEETREYGWSKIIRKSLPPVSQQFAEGNCSGVQVCISVGSIASIYMNAYIRIFCSMY